MPSETSHLCLSTRGPDYDSLVICVNVESRSGLIWLTLDMDARCVFRLTLRGKLSCPHCFTTLQLQTPQLERQLPVRASPLQPKFNG